RAGLELALRRLNPLARQVCPDLVDERFAGDAGAGIDGGPGRHVEREDGRALVQRLEVLPDGFWGLRRRRLPGLQHVNGDLVPRLEKLRQLRPRSVHADLLRPDQLVEMAQGKVLEAPAEDLVQPLPGSVRAHLEAELHRGWLSENRETRQVPSCWRASPPFAPRCISPPP